jgi:hypothetical protein
MGYLIFFKDFESKAKDIFLQNRKDYLRRVCLKISNGKRFLKNLTKNILKESAGAFLANDL